MADENLLLSRMEQLINDKLQTFEQRINATQRALSQTQLSAIQENLNSDGYTFKKKGHEQQFKVNAKVLDKMHQADGYIQEAERDSSQEAVENARQKIVEGINILNYRQKCIKLADSSEHGWKVVQEYETRPLADDEEDEKKIARAQIQADRKVRQERRLRAARFSKPYPSTKPYSPGNFRVSGEQSSQQRERPSGTNTRRPGSCFSCGRPGYWRADCRARGVVESSQTEKLDQISKDLCISNSSKNRTCVSIDVKLSKTQTHRFEPVTRETRSQEMVSSVGRLKQSVKHWKESCVNPYIIDVIENGYKLPFKELPVSTEIKNIF